MSNFVTNRAITARISIIARFLPMQEYGPEVERISLARTSEEQGQRGKGKLGLTDLGRMVQRLVCL